MIDNVYDKKFFSRNFFFFNLVWLFWGLIDEFY